MIVLSLRLLLLLLSVHAVNCSLFKFIYRSLYKAPPQNCSGPHPRLLENDFVFTDFLANEYSESDSETASIQLSAFIELTKELCGTADSDAIILEAIEEFKSKPDLMILHWQFHFQSFSNFLNHRKTGQYPVSDVVMQKYLEFIIEHIFFRSPKGSSSHSTMQDSLFSISVKLIQNHQPPTLLELVVQNLKQLEISKQVALFNISIFSMNQFHESKFTSSEARTVEARLIEHHLILIKAFPTVFESGLYHSIQSALKDGSLAQFQTLNQMSEICFILNAPPPNWGNANVRNALDRLKNQEIGFNHWKLFNEMLFRSKFSSNFGLSQESFQRKSLLFSDILRAFIHSAEFYAIAEPIVDNNLSSFLEAILVFFKPEVISTEKIIDVIKIVLRLSINNNFTPAAMLITYIPEITDDLITQAAVRLIDQNSKVEFDYEFIAGFRRLVSLSNRPEFSQLHTLSNEGLEAIFHQEFEEHDAFNKHALEILELGRIYLARSFKISFSVSCPKSDSSIPRSWVEFSKYINNQIHACLQQFTGNKVH